jgi:transcriptional regulator with XRE-family HTH domain
MFLTDTVPEKAACYQLAMSFKPSILHLAAWRKQSGQSQEAIADRIGYSRGYIAKAETRPQNLTIAFLEAFAEGVGAPSLTALFAKPEDLDDRCRELLDHFEFIPTEKRQTLIDVARGLSERDRPEYVDDSA